MPIELTQSVIEAAGVRDGADVQDIQLTQSVIEAAGVRDGADVQDIQLTQTVIEVAGDASATIHSVGSKFTSAPIEVTPEWSESAAWDTLHYPVRHAYDIYDLAQPRYHWTLAQLDAAYVRRDGTLALTAPWDAGAFEITSDTFDADTAYFLGGVNINVGGTLSNMAYLDQANVFLAALNTFNGTILHNGRIENINTVAKVANYNVLVTDDNIVCDTSGGAFTVTLPAAPEDGRVYTVILETAGNTLTISGNGNNIIGAATATLSTVFDAIQLIYSGAQWLLK